MGKQLLLTVLMAVLLSTGTWAASRFTRQTQSCGCGVQVTTYVLRQATTLPALTPSDLVALNYVIQALSNPTLTTNQIRSAIALAFANTVQPVDAAQQVTIAIQGLTSIQQYLQSSILPIATTFRYQVSQSIAVLTQYQLILITLITNGGATPGIVPTLGSLPVGTLPALTLPTIASIHSSHEHISQEHTSHEHHSAQIG